MDPSWHYFVVLSFVWVNMFDAGHCLSCHEAYSCAFSDVLDHPTADCYGYSSCAFTKRIELNNVSDGTVNCHGSYSCYGVSQMNVIDDKDWSIDCDGLYSCANIESMSLDLNESQYSSYSGKVSCSGELSCFNTSIDIKVSGALLVECTGERSCANGNVSIGGRKSATVVSVGGYLGAMNATFYILESNNTWISFYGTSSGKNATIICGKGLVCNVDCTTDACKDLDMRCDTDADGNEYEDCRFSIDVLDRIYGEYDGGFSDLLGIGWDELVPDIYGNGNSDQLEAAAIGTDYNNSYEACAIGANMSSIDYSGLNDTGTIRIDTGDSNQYPVNCQDYHECTDAVLSTTLFVDRDVDSITVPLCCTASEGCKDSDNITVSSDSGTNKYGIGIRCDGGSACKLANKIESNGDGNVYFSGQYGGCDTKLIDIASKKGDIMCSGDTSCANANEAVDISIIQNGKNVYCTGRWSCKYIHGDNTETVILDSNATLPPINRHPRMIIQNIGDSVYMYGLEAGELSAMVNISGSVYCSNEDACASGIMDGVGGNVYGTGEECLGHSNISNVMGSIYALGYRAINEANVTNVGKTMYIYGHHAAKETNMKNVTNIVVTGEEALEDATIRQVRSIYASGDNTLLGANITSDLGSITDGGVAFAGSIEIANATIQSDRTLTISINGTNGGIAGDDRQFSVYCSEGDICNINCSSSHACDNLDLHCEGVCNVVGWSNDTDNGGGSGGGSGSSAEKTSHTVVLIVCIGVAILFVCLGSYCYYRHNHRQLQLGVGLQMDSDATQTFVKLDNEMEEAQNQL